MKKPRKKRTPRRKRELALQAVALPAPVAALPVSPLERLGINLVNGILNFAEDTIKTSTVFQTIDELGIVSEQDLAQMRNSLEREIQTEIGLAPKDPAPSDEYQRGRSDVIEEIRNPRRS